jgi:hypothetical protein
MFSGGKPNVQARQEAWMRYSRSDTREMDKLGAGWVELSHGLRSKQPRFGPALTVSREPPRCGRWMLAAQSGPATPTTLLADSGE